VFSKRIFLISLYYINFSLFKLIYLAIFLDFYYNFFSTDVPYNYLIRIMIYFILNFIELIAYIKIFLLIYLIIIIKILDIDSFLMILLMSNFLLNNQRGITMYGDSGDSTSKRLLLLIIIALFVVIGATVFLNGGMSTEVEENNTTSEENVTPEVTSNITSTVIGNNSWGTVTKMSGYGNQSSETHIALVVGVDESNVSNNSIAPTLEGINDLNYAYDIYMVNVANDNQDNGTQDTSSNMTLNDKSEQLANEYVVPDIINNKYNCTVDMHYTNDSNSYVFVPSENTVTSKNLVNYISDTTSIGIYMPDKYSYAQFVSIPIINSDKPSIVYVTREFYSSATSNEFYLVMKAIDSFNFGDMSIYSNDTSSNTNSSNSTSNQSSNYTNTSNQATVSREVD